MTRQQRTVLIVDSCAEDRKTYRQCLLEDREFAYTILEEASGESGLSLCKLLPLDGILLAFQLPDLNGLEFLLELKQHSGNDYPPVVIVTNQGSAAIAVKAIKSGAQDYLVKGEITPDELRLAVRSAIENAHLRRELQLSEQRFRTSVENMLDCFGIYSSIRDESGQITDFQVEYVNAAACASNRMTPEEQIGKRLCQLFSAQRESGLFAEYCQVVETGQPLIKESLIYSDFFGAQRLTRAYDCRISKLNDGFVASWRDVTERQQTEVALREAFTQVEQRAAALTASNQQLQIALEELQTYQEELKQQAELEVARESSELQLQRYQDLFNFAPDGYIVTDINGTIQEANRAVVALLLANQEDLIDKPLSVFIVPQELSAFYQLLNQLVASMDRLASIQPMQTWELNLQPYKGKSFPAQVAVAAVHNGEGQPIGWCWLIRDITQRKQAEEQLRQSQQFIQQVATATPGILYVYDLIEQQNVYVNNQVTQLLGYTPEQVQAMGANILPRLIHPEDFVRIPAHLEQFRSLPNGAVIEWEYRMQHANGEWRWFWGREVVFSKTVENLPHQILGITQDITERKRTEIALLQSNQRFELAAAAVNCLIYDWDVQNSTVERTQGLTELVGYTPEEAEPTLKWWRDRVHPEDFQRIYDQFMASIATTDRFCSEYRVRHKDGHYVWVQDQEIILRDAEGNPIRIVGSTTDISDRKQAETELRHNQERLQRMLETSPIGIGIAKSTGEILEINDALLSILGYTREEFLSSGLNWRAISPPEFAEMDRQAMERLQQTESVETAEKRIIRKDGSELPILIGATRLPGEADEHVAFIVDLSERKQVEAALAEQERRYRYIFEAVGVSIWQEDFSEVKAAIEQLKAQGIQDFRTFFAQHPDFVQQAVGMVRILNVNQATVQLFEAQTKDRLLTSLDQIFVPETLEVFVAELLAIAAGETFFTAETILQTLQGERINVLFTVTFPPPTASFDRGLVTLFDITERKRTVEALQESEARFRGVVESDLIGILFWNAEGQITDANDAFIRMIGYSREEMQAGQVNYNDITPPEYHELDAHKFEILQKTGKSSPLEKEYICKDGSRIPILLGCTFLPGFRDRGVAFVVDISEQKRLEQERQALLASEQAAREAAEVANRTKDEFLAIVSHELRSPLNSILGWARLLRTRNFDSVTTARALETIERNAQAQSQLIEDLLDVSRMIRGNLRLDLAPVNIASVVETTINSVRPSAEAKQIQLEFVLNSALGEDNQTRGQPDKGKLQPFSPCPFLVSGDLNRLQQIVTNLLTNAIKFTPQGGRVEIALERVSSHAQIRVTDTGKGISPNFLPYIFERFRQADNTTTRSKDGLGLGLAIVRHLVELHNGIVTADSPGEGQGATFTVKLPLLQRAGGAGKAGGTGGVGEKTQSKIQNPKSKIPSPLTGLRILVVDDEADTRAFLHFTLEEYGAVVKAVASAKEVLEILNQFQPDILLSDIGMPEEDGYTLLRRLRSLASERGEKQIPALALTAYARKEDREQAFSAGFRHHLTKPVEPAELVAAIASLLGEQAR